MAPNPLRNALLGSRNVRTTLLRMLRPFDIAKLLAATGVEISKQDRLEHMPPILDLVDDTKALNRLRAGGVRIMFVGADLELLVDRLVDPLQYLEFYGKDYMLNIMVMAFRDEQDGSCCMAKFLYTREAYMDTSRPHVADVVCCWMRHEVVTMPEPDQVQVPLSDGPRLSFLPAFHGSTTRITLLRATDEDLEHRALFLDGTTARCFLYDEAGESYTSFSEYCWRLNDINIPTRTWMREAEARAMATETQVDIDFYTDNIIIEVGPGDRDGTITAMYKIRI